MERLPNGDYLITSYSDDGWIVRKHRFRGKKGDWYNADTGQALLPSWSDYCDGLLKLEEWKEIDQGNPT